MAKSSKIQTAATAANLLDEIKDEIDRLHEIRSPKRKLEAARDLVDYITLHHIDYQEG
jgi:cell fate (sporulation/competence/biofilm development) regulator YmcA (YheA/YmcA/DUF963 family)